MSTGQNSSSSSEGAGGGHTVCVNDLRCACVCLRVCAVSPHGAHPTGELLN